MTVTITKSADEKALQNELDALIDEYANNPSAELEKRIIKIYETLTNYKSGCSVCIKGRREFIRGLNSIKQGNFDSALQSMKRSLGTVKLKWKILTSK